MRASADAGVQLARARRTAARARSSSRPVVTRWQRRARSSITCTVIAVIVATPDLSPRSTRASAPGSRHPRPRSCSPGGVASREKNSPVMSPPVHSATRRGPPPRSTRIERCPESTTTSSCTSQVRWPSTAPVGMRRTSPCCASHSSCARGTSLSWRCAARRSTREASVTVRLRVERARQWKGADRALSDGRGSRGKGRGAPPTPAPAPTTSR